MKTMGKQVMLINTAELFGGKHVPFFHCATASYVKELSELNEFDYKGIKIPFMQFDNNMPNIEDCQSFIDFLLKHKPEYIINIGGSSLLMDVCAQIIPVLNINTVPSEIGCTNATMQAIGRKIQDNDLEYLKWLNKTEENVIEGRFTWLLKEQTHKYTRSQLDISEDAFIMVAIGGRLTHELTMDFVEVLHPAFEKGALLFIVGNMDTYEEFCCQDELFGNHAIYLGMQDDVLAILDLCDLYVNPKRVGGGSSVVEAMYKGCPAVSLNFGDVALGAGEEFCVESYEEMQKQILRYMTDKQYYEEMSEKAKKRAIYDLDSDSAFVDIVNEFEQKIMNSEPIKC